MHNLLKREMNFSFIPPILRPDFICMVIDSVCEQRFVLLSDIANCVDDFSIYAHSFYETGKLFQMIDDETIDEEVLETIRIVKRMDLELDVEEVLDCHRLFFLDDDCFLRNVPIIRVW